MDILDGPKNISLVVSAKLSVYTIIIADLISNYSYNIKVDCFSFRLQNIRVATPILQFPIVLLLETSFHNII